MCEVTDLFWRSGYAIGEEKGERRGERRGVRRGKRIGRNQGILLTRRAQSLFSEGKTKQEIAKTLNLSEEEVALMVE